MIIRYLDPWGQGSSNQFDLLLTACGEFRAYRA